MRVKEFRANMPEIGLTLRTGTEGLEKELADAFVSFIPGCFRWRSGAVAVFHEPQLESGFPDLVVVQYVPEVFADWSGSRNNLKPMDLKLLHHLHSTAGADSAAILESLGLRGLDALRSLERLVDAGLIVRSSGEWQALPLSRIFGLRAIVAIEAKIKNWISALKQAQLNQWFASESYVLAPVEEPTKAVVERSQRAGVGVFLLNGQRSRRIARADRSRIPSCYGSWMFNEWVGRWLNCKR